MSFVARLFTGCLVLVTLIVFAGVVAGYSIFRFSDGDTVRGAWSEPLDGARTISANIEVDHGNVTVADSLPAGPALTGDIALQTEYRAGSDMPIARSWEVRDGSGVARLGSAPANPPHAFLHWLRSPEEATWDVGVTPQVPLDLGVDVAVGSARLDLAGLTTTRFSVNVAVGSADIIVGDGTAATGVSRVRVGVGDVRLTVADDVPVRIQVTAGISDITSTDGFVFDGSHYTNAAWRALVDPATGADPTNGMDIVIETGTGSVSLATLVAATPGPVAGTGADDGSSRSLRTAPSPAPDVPTMAAPPPVDSLPENRRP